MNSASEAYEQKMLLTLTPEQRASYLADKLEKRRIKAMEDLAESNLSCPCSAKPGRCLAISRIWIE